MTELAAQASELAALLVASGPEADLFSPYDGTVSGRLPTSTGGDVAAAAEAARGGQVEWARRPVRDREGVLLAFHDRLLDEREALADLVQRESGKSRLSAMEEVLHLALTARYYGLRAERFLRPERGTGLIPGITTIERRFVPKGLVGVIGPWNYPLTMAVCDGLAAIVAGNAVLAKPDAQTPLIALVALRMLRECGMPDALWQVVHGPGSEVGPALIDESDYVCFTGSTATGRLVAERCSGRLIGCSLELGGKNPLLVLDDADLARCVPGIARACFANAGQLCVSAERIYVVEPLYEAFCVAFGAVTAALRLGSSPDYGVDVGCLINPGQVERTEAHVEDARAKGALVLTGGRRRPDLGPLFYEPTVLVGVRRGMTCYADETFGPVVSIYPATDDADAISQANDSPYGLNASVWTDDPRRGRRVAAELRCGTVNVNDGFSATFGSIDAPMGGMKRSGLGRRQGRDGIRRFVEVQSVGTQATWLPLRPTRAISAGKFAAAVDVSSRVFRRIGRP